MAAFTRRNTLLFSNQRDENTCAYHVCSKLLLKNVVELFYPLPVEPGVYNTNNCNRYLDTKDIELTTLTPEECTQNGFLKIIMFHYFFSLYDTHLNRRGKKLPKEALSIYDIDIADSYMKNMIIPDTTYRKEIKHILSIVKHAKGELGIHYYKSEVYAKEGILDSIEKILSLGFYICVALFDKYSQEEHARHAVHIVGIDKDENEIIFKNSWGDERVYNMKVDDLQFKLGPYKFKIEYFLFYLPCKLGRAPIETVRSPDMTEFSKWIDDYVRQFPEMMAGLPEILATMPADEPAEEPAAYEPKPSFAVGDVVKLEAIPQHPPLTLIESLRNGSKYLASYIDEHGDKKETILWSYELIKVGGRRRRKSRKRIR